MIGIICALKIEVDGLKEIMKEKEEKVIAGLSFVRGKIFEKDIVLLECGIGKVNASIGTQIMIDYYAPDTIINSGIAGSLSKDLKIGDIVISKDCVQHDMDTSALGDPKGLICYTDEKRIDIPADENTAEKLFRSANKTENTKVLLGTVATGDKFVSLVEERKEIAHMFSSLCCEMEGGAVGHTCYRNGVPFAVMRCISDDFNNNESMDYEQFKFLASDKTIAVMKDFIKNF
ncbi:MAG: 5'-methylthioadenosine/adenosylhomocysteine nucleosidase [Acutalibacteraceae bacterium]